MSAKKRKGQSFWATCDHCSVIIPQKDSLLHEEKSCPPNSETWIHSYIANEKLYATVDTFQLKEKCLELISKENRNDYILMPLHVLQLCKIQIGDPVIIKPCDNSAVPFLKFAWATVQDKTTDFTAFLSNEGIKLNSLTPKSQIIVHKIQDRLFAADTITVGNEIEVNATTLRKLLPRLQSQNVNKIFCIGNNISIRHYGSKIVFKIIDMATCTAEETQSNRFCLVTSETKWKLSNANSKIEKLQCSLDQIGGLDSTISDLKDVISLGLSGKNTFLGLHLTKGILIHGPPGTGKTTLLQALAANFTTNIVQIDCSQIYSKLMGETEKELTNYFKKAKEMSPSIILIDDLDILCTKSSSSSDFEKRVIATLSLLMDKLNNELETTVMVLGATSKIHQIDTMLRSACRFGKEVEIYVPSNSQRLEILKILLKNVDHDLKEDDVKVVADSCHGFVGADLSSLVSKAILRNFKSVQRAEKLTLDDFEWAMSKVKPSAMKEIMIEVPSVRWSEIGGQEELKLKLKQCVEWPLKYGDAFTKLGINPPKGVLMFGPPGCSKTMIAKALATESKLNFISVKGPELFSKWVGESERAVRKVFRRARQAAPSIIFFDELDAIGGERNMSSGSSVQERVLAQMLTEVDGVESLDNVTVIAATNRLDRIDPALIRPGRLDRIIYVPLPDPNTRKEIFTLQLKKSNISEDVLIDELVEKSQGYSGAEIVAVCREAALKALEENIKAEIVCRKHFINAFTIVVPRTPKSLLDMYDKYLMK